MESPTCLLLKYLLIFYVNTCRYSALKWIIYFILLINDIHIFHIWVLCVCLYVWPVHKHISLLIFKMRSARRWILKILCCLLFCLLGYHLSVRWVLWPNCRKWVTAQRVYLNIVQSTQKFWIWICKNVVWTKCYAIVVVVVFVVGWVRVIRVTKMFEII